MNKKLGVKRLQVVASLLIGGVTISSSIYPDMPISKLNEVLDNADLHITQEEIFDVLKREYTSFEAFPNRKIVEYFGELESSEFSGHVRNIKRIVFEQKLAKSRDDKLHKKTNHEGTDIIKHRDEYLVKSGKKRLQIAASLLILGTAGKDIYTNITVKELNEVLNKADMHITQEEVFEAVKRGYSDLENASDREIVEYFSDIDEVEFSGHISNIKGIAFEQELARATDAELHEQTNHEGTDIIIDGNEYSVKSGISNQAANEDLEEGLDVIATSEIATKTEIIDGGMTNEELTSQVLDGLGEEIVAETIIGTVLDSPKIIVGGALFTIGWAVEKVIGKDLFKIMDEENKKYELKNKREY